LADPRAQRDYELQGEGEDDSTDEEDLASEKLQCRRCEYPPYLPDPEETTPDDPELENIKELLVGGPYLRAFLIAENCTQELPDDPDSGGCNDDASAAANNTYQVIKLFEHFGNQYYASESGGSQARPPEYVIPGGTAEVVAWADAVPAPAQVSLTEPALNPAMWSPGEAGVGVSLVSGDLLFSTVDQAVAGRGLDFVMDRSYRSGTLGYGPLGNAGWTGSLFAHLREIRTTGEVEYHDGQGNVWRFYPEYGVPPPGPNDPEAPYGFHYAVKGAYDDDQSDIQGQEGGEKPKYFSTYYTPEGIYLVLQKLAGDRGWRLIGRNNDVALFDEAGRLVELRDRLRQDADDPDEQGNTIRLIHDAYGQLIELVDDYGRLYTFEYYDDPEEESYGLLKEFRDFVEQTDRTVGYEYEERRLEKVTLPTVTSDVAGADSYSEPTIEYSYVETEFDEQAIANGEHFSKFRLKGYRLPGASGDRVTVSFCDDGRVDDVSYPADSGAIKWDLDWTLSDGPGLVTKVMTTSPWQSRVEYDIDSHSRTTEVRQTAVPTLWPGEALDARWSEPLYRIDVRNPLLHNARLPSGLERGADPVLFRWSGYSDGCMPQVIIDQIPGG
ncbi:MAG: hypothetical protein GY835_05025, partial [bacterium]|nr:hypothetical protein [bacterium]